MVMAKVVVMVAVAGAVGYTHTHTQVEGDSRLGQAYQPNLAVVRRLQAELAAPGPPLTTHRVCPHHHAPFPFNPVPLVFHSTILFFPFLELYP